MECTAERPAAATVESAPPPAGGDLAATLAHTAAADGTWPPSEGPFYIVIKDGEEGDHIQHAARDAGFRLSSAPMATLSAYGLMDLDTDRPIATLRTVLQPDAAGWIEEQQLHFDPVTAAPESGAGTRLFTAIAKLLTAMHGTAHHPDGRLVTTDELFAMADHIDGVMDREIAAMQPQPVQQADGTFRTQGALSFIGTYHTARGRFLRTDFFDVTAPSPVEAAGLGLQMAKEALHYVVTHRRSAVDLGQLVRAALAKPELRLVGGAFIDAITTIAEAGARHTQYGAWLDRLIDAEDIYVRQRQEAEAGQRAEFVQRMAAGRAAKRAQGRQP